MIHRALSFVAVVKAGSFSNAAKNMGVSKARISRHVSQLEAELGIQLLYRTTRSITLTESGEAFYASCCDIEESYEDAVDQLKQEFSSLKGTLRMTAPISFGSEFLPKIIHQFHQEYPHIKIILSLSSSTEDLVEKNFDLSLRIAPSLPDSSLRMRKIMTLDMVLCASASYFADKPYPQKITDLADHQCITSVNRNLSLTKINWSFYENKKIIKFTPNSIIEVDSPRAQIQLIALGTGIGRVPAIFIEKELESGQIVRILPNVEQPPNQLYLLYANRPVLPKKLKIFIEFLIANTAT